MRIIVLISLVAGICLAVTGCYEETRVLVNAEFQLNLEENSHTAPVSLSVQNQTTGADFYQWSFEGGSPDRSSEQHPAKVVYEKAGEYTIRLEAWNNNERDVKELSFSVDSAVSIVFDAEVLLNDFAPAEVQITNRTVGASVYTWTFEGGKPSSSDEQHPGIIRFDTPGQHTISLKVSNGRESFTTERSITLLPRMAVDFEIIPSFDDFDYEVPFTARLQNKTVSGLTYEWESTGGVIASAREEHTEIFFDTPGTYTIRLRGSNGKESLLAGREITLKPNTNLYTMENVRFGIKKAEATLGCFYSLSKREVWTAKEIDASTGPLVNFLFFGLDASFSRCYFLSPADALNSGFAGIPGATETYLVNDLSRTSLSFTDADFLAMKDDGLLRSLDIKAASSTDSWFTHVFIPRLVLFETAEGVKGAIRIKAFVSEGDRSYILCDMKVQKEKAQ